MHSHQQSSALPTLPKKIINTLDKLPVKILHDTPVMIKELKHNIEPVI